MHEVGAASGMSGGRGSGGLQTLPVHLTRVAHITLLTSMGRRAAACMKLGRPADALADAEAAVAADAGYAKGYLRRALAHQALGALEDAVRDFEKVRAPQ